MSLMSKRNVLNRLSIGLMLLIFCSGVYSQAPSISYFVPTSAAPGDHVQIYGYYFNGTTSVKFGGVSALSYSILSSSLINAVVDSGASGNVVVTNLNGSNSSGGFSVYYTPRIDSISPTMTYGNDTINIYGANFKNVTSVKFGGVAASWFTVINQHLIRALALNTASGNVQVQTILGSYTGALFYYLKKPVISGFSPAAGSQYDYINIYGQNLASPDGNTPVVTFGGAVSPQVYFYDGTNPHLSAQVGQAKSGCIKVSHLGGMDSTCGFSFIPPPIITSFTPVSAQPADTVTIRGKHFTNLSGTPDVLNVYFGDSAAASYSVINDSIIKAVVSHGKSGNISIGKSAGNAYKSGFVFLPLPHPVLSSFTPNGVLTGTTIQVMGQYLWGITSVKVGDAKVKLFRQINFHQMEFVAPVAASGKIYLSTYYGTDSLSSPLFNRILPSKINSFSPMSAMPGAQVTIYGNNFGIDYTKVSVLFGGLQAQVMQVTNDSIKVLVPFSAGYDPITVVANNLVTQSADYFSPNNPAISGYHLSTDGFEIIDPVTGGIGYDAMIKSADFNMDGKPDIIALSGGDYSMHCYLNKSHSPDIFMQSSQPPGLSTGVVNFDIGEIDGDGKPDLLIYNQSNMVGCAINTSTNDSIKFNFIDGRLGNNFEKFVDVNGDGKLDVVNRAVNISGPTNVILNNSIPGTVHFNDTLSLNTPYPYDYYNVANFADLDKDGLPDMIATSGNSVFVFRNIGTLKMPDYNDTPIVLTVNTGTSFDYYVEPERVICTDMNLDGKLDLLVSHNAYNTASFAMYKNISTPGHLHFANFQLVNNCRVYSSFSVVDFNGDGKPDIMVGDESSLAFYENRSNIDSIQLAEQFMMQGGTGTACGVDLDGDNKQDVVSSSYGGLHYYRNILGEPVKKIICPGSNIQFVSDTTGTVYQWQVRTDSGYRDMIPSINITGATTNILTFNQVPSSWQQKVVRCKVNDSYYSKEYVIRFENTWTGNVNQLWNNPGNWSCGIVPDEYTAVLIPPYSTILVTQNANCWSLKLSLQSNVMLDNGVQFHIMH